LEAPAQALVNSQLWWYGPEWLSEEESKWPDSTELEDSSIQENIGIYMASQHEIDFYGEPLEFLSSPTGAKDERVTQD
jgi:hypothetical protein